MAKSTFGGDFELFAEDFMDASEESIRATAIYTWSAIIESSPVDEGRFRANWFATGKKASTKVTNKTDYSGVAAKANAQQVVMSNKDWSIFQLTNNLPYAQVIEYGLYKDGPNTTDGYSSQAVGGVVRVNMARVKANLEAEFKKRAPK